MSHATSDSRRDKWDDWAELYDLFIAERKDRDIPFFVKAAEHASGGPVLEVGSGSGRVLIALAQALSDRRFVGLDFSQKMLERCRMKLGRETDEVRSRVELRHGDILRADLEENTYSLALFVYGTFGLLYKDGEAAAAVKAVAKALQPGGRVIVERRNRFAARYHVGREFDWIKAWPGREHTVVCQSRSELIVDPVRQIRQTIFFYEWIDTSCKNERGESKKENYTFYTREFSPLDIQEMLEDTGLHVVDCYGDYDLKRRFQPTDERIIFVAEKL